MEILTVLSDRYRRIDNEHILQAILPSLMANPHTQVLTSQITEKKMYLMLAFVNREAEVKKGDVIHAGIIITNSEIGLSSYSVLPYVHRLWCLNGAVVDDAGKYGLKRVHIGRRVESDENLIAYKDDTLKADDQALQLKMRDVVDSISAGPVWDEIVTGLKAAAESKPIEKPVVAVKELGKSLQLSESEQEGFLTNLLKNGDLTRWGAGNAITQMANDMGEQYDRSVELQAIGGKLFTMPERDWNAVAEAA